MRPTVRTEIEVEDSCRGLLPDHRRAFVRSELFSACLSFEVCTLTDFDCKLMRIESTQLLQEYDIRDWDFLSSVRIVSHREGQSHRANESVHCTDVDIMEAGDVPFSSSEEISLRK